MPPPPSATVRLNATVSALLNSSTVNAARLLRTATEKASPAYTGSGLASTSRAVLGTAWLGDSAVAAIRPARAADACSRGAPLGAHPHPVAGGVSKRQVRGARRAGGGGEQNQHRGGKQAGRPPVQGRPWHPSRPVRGDRRVRARLVAGNGAGDRVYLVRGCRRGTGHDPAPRRRRTAADAGRARAHGERADSAAAARSGGQRRPPMRAATAVCSRAATCAAR